MCCCHYTRITTDSSVNNAKLFDSEALFSLLLCGNRFSSDIALLLERGLHAIAVVCLLLSTLDKRNAKDSFLFTDTVVEGYDMGEILLLLLALGLPTCSGERGDKLGEVCRIIVWY